MTEILDRRILVQEKFRQKKKCVVRIIKKYDARTFGLRMSEKNYVLQTARENSKNLQLIKQVALALTRLRMCEM